jgi:hypothetical protein
VTSDRVPSRSPHFLLERMDGELLLYHPGLTRTLLLNETASMIWELCDGRRSERVIVRLVAGAFPEAGDAVIQDVEATLRRFAEEGAIEFR